MNRTELFAACDRAKRLLWWASELNRTSFAAMLVGVPLTLAAFMGLSPWPGVICWTMSWATFALNSYLLAQATKLNAQIRQANDERLAELTRKNDQ